MANKYDFLNKIGLGNVWTNIKNYISSFTFSKAELNTKLDGKADTSGTYSGLNVGYATSSGTANYLGNVAEIVYGVNRLNYFNTNTGTTSGATNVANPTNGWYYHLVMNHGNHAGYYFDIACAFFDSAIYYRRVEGGTEKTWVRLIDSSTIGSQSVNYANSAGSVAWGNVSGKPNLMPREDTGYKTISSNGQTSWCKFATITIYESWANYPICFEVSGRGLLKSTLQLTFASTDSIDPGLDSFFTDGDTNFYIKRTATSTWELYCRYFEIWGSFTLYRVIKPNIIPEKVDVDTTLVNLESEPTDKIQCSLYSEGIEEQGDGYIRYASGVQICWGNGGNYNVVDKGITVVEFPRAFLENPSISVNMNETTDFYTYVCQAHGIRNTFFLVYTYSSQKWQRVFDSAGYSWQAIGRWK